MVQYDDITLCDLRKLPFNLSRGILYANFSCHTMPYARTVKCLMAVKLEITPLDGIRNNVHTGHKS